MHFLILSYTQVKLLTLNPNNILLESATIETLGKAQVIKK